MVQNCWCNQANESYHNNFFPVRDIPETQFPASVSIDTFLSAWKFTEKAVLNFERFEIETATWKNVLTVGYKAESVKFSFCAFQDAFYATTVQRYKWVLKT